MGKPDSSIRRDCSGAHCAPQNADLFAAKPRRGAGGRLVAGSAAAHEAAPWLGTGGSTWLTRSARAALALYQNLNKADYETILQVRKETPVTWNGNTATAASWVNRLSGTQRHYVLYQPDVCLPTWAPNNDNKNSRTGGNQYRYEQGTTYYDGTYYVEYEGALWDGFTVRHGYIKN